MITQWSNRNKHIYSTKTKILLAQHLQDNKVLQKICTKWNAQKQGKKL